MPLICSVFMLLKIYKEKAKKIVVLIGLYGFFAILILSLLKFYGEATSNSAGNFTLKENSSLINAYFGGLKNVIVGLKAYINNGFSLSVFINDIFRNAMGVSQFFVDNLNNSVSIFNLQYYGARIADDQICPTIIEGLLSFGPILFFIPTYIMVTTVCWMDYKWHTTTSLEFSYLLAYMGTLIGWCVPGNMMHLSSSIFNIYIPMCTLFIVNRRFKI